MKIYKVAVGSKINVHINNSWYTQTVFERLTFEDADVIERDNVETHFKKHRTEFFIRNDNMEIINS